MIGHLNWESNCRSKNRNHAARRFYSVLKGALHFDLDQVHEERWKTTIAIANWNVAHDVIPGYRLIQPRLDGISGFQTRPKSPRTEEKMAGLAVSLAVKQRETP